MRLQPFLIALFFCLFSSLQGAGSGSWQLTNVSTARVVSESEFLQIIERPGPLLKLLHKGAHLNRKATAAILAFPFPFGIVGLHRIYLGSAPYVPVVYIASLGGIFGLLPLIDFIVILTEKDVEQFANSGKVFMWVE